MRGLNSLSALVIVLLVVFVFGCSSDTGVAPADTENDIDISALGTLEAAGGPASTWGVTARGTVYDKYGDYAVGVSVRIDYYKNSTWSEPLFATTNQYGFFSYEIQDYLKKGDKVRAACLGDVETIIYDGTAGYTTFTLEEQVNDTKLPHYMDPENPKP